MKGTPQTQFTISDAVRAGGETNTKTAMVRKPFQRVSDGSPVDDASANAAQAVPKVQASQSFGLTREDPAQAN